ncbi:uncharacterized protein LOC127751120 isoform X1 [Frankliniella occidentalis]|uniref:Uncharacterized protein LOC127751120 isoform X1 n=1 Tax=Frankliniella occidentalis TaxID=133901 RepID=A0A9C6X6P8_FRAOC|nr:uncharacterized protein LOC127751120 isoform X1 [Frankliniella occidentalis]
MLFRLVTTALALCPKGIYGKAFNSLVGPYIAYTEQFSLCDPDPNHPIAWKWYLRSTHFNPFKPKELQLVTGNITGLIDIGDDYGGVAILDIRSNNQWKENAFVFSYKKNVCRAIRDNIPGFTSVFFKIKPTGPCIFKRGFYEVNNAPIDWTFPNVPVMPYGHYRFKLMMSKAGQYDTCYVAECRIIPKLE